MNLKNGYFDLQVNGYGGVDFNSGKLTPDSLNLACKTLQSDGVDGILATIITDDVEVMCNRLRRIVELREQNTLVGQIIAGIHIEGPFINETAGYRGAHPVDAIRPADIETMKLLLDAGGGLVRIVTLAPERDDGLAVTKYLAHRGIVVSAGHCDSTLDELIAAIDAGLGLFTHLGNGCPGQMDRHDNIIQRVLSLADKLALTFIADGVHIPFFALKNYLNIAGTDNCVIVSDAMAAAGLGPGRYTIGRWNLEIGKDLAARAPDGTHLVGSAMSMHQGRINLEEHLGLDDTQIHHLTAVNPRRLIGLD